MGDDADANLSVSPMVIPAHNLARWVRTEMAIANGVMEWQVPRTILGVLPFRRDRIAASTADVEGIAVTRAVRRPVSLTIGLATIVAPFILGWGWWGLLTVPFGLWISLVSLGPRMVATTFDGSRLPADVCFGHQIDADLYIAAVHDIGAEIRAQRAGGESSDQAVVE